MIQIYTASMDCCDFSWMAVSIGCFRERLGEHLVLAVMGGVWTCKLSSTSNSSSLKSCWRTEFGEDSPELSLGSEYLRGMDNWELVFGDEERAVPAAEFVKVMEGVAGSDTRRSLSGESSFSELESFRRSGIALFDKLIARRSSGKARRSESAWLEDVDSWFETVLDRFDWDLGERNFLRDMVRRGGGVSGWSSSRKFMLLLRSWLSCVLLASLYFSWASCRRFSHMAWKWQNIKLV